jgi:glutamine phosphoribosylpyrophosphate amidotransferase
MSEISQYTESLHEECGVFGVFSTNKEKNVAPLVYYGLFALQSRNPQHRAAAAAQLLAEE